MTLNRWLTEEEIATAKSNGISRRTLNMRVYNYGWDLQEAITIPPRTYWHMSGRSNKWLKLAEENGINKSTFYTRLEIGWEPQEAATRPVRKLNSIKEMIQLAESNGINASTFRSRVSLYGWDPYKAATTPAQKRKTKGKIS